MLLSNLPIEDELNLDMTPGCFGSPTAYNPELPDCQTCEFVDLCGLEAAKARDRLLRDLGLSEEVLATRTVSKPKPAPKRPPVAGPSKPVEKKAEPAAPIPGVSKKGGELVRAIQREVSDLGALLRAGENPFVNRTPRYMGVVCDMLLAGGFTKRELRLAFIDRLGWSDGTASAHVSIVVSALPAIGAVVERGGRFVIKE